MANQGFWKEKRVFLTGHTGFKGSWLSLWLDMLGARVTGYSLKPPTKPSLFELCRIDRLVKSTLADIRDFDRLKKSLAAAEPEIVIHMAAQPLVLESYRNPVETYSTNVMGTVHLLEAVRQCGGALAVVNVTSDKCYENKERQRGYRENESMGGHDPYSSSKGCSELVTAAYRSSFFSADTPSPCSPEPRSRRIACIASARAGNVVGGGDWAENRLIPDCVRTILKGKTIEVRNPGSTRPWQHVLEPLSGYLLLVEKLFRQGQEYAQAWNFGPDPCSEKPVEWVVKRFCGKWGAGASYRIVSRRQPHEARFLRLDSSKARAELGWRPVWDLDTALGKVVEWTKAYKDGKDARKVCLKQIEEYSS